jgi:uncharacterized glyoxalase superfamily protein PhnB
MSQPNHATPFLTVQDVWASVRFYQAVFGLEVGQKAELQGQIIRMSLCRNGEAVLMLSPEGALGAKIKSPASASTDIPVTFFMYVDDVDATMDAGVKAGAKITMPPQNLFWGERMGMLMDIDGYRWNVAMQITAK